MRSLTLLFTALLALASCEDTGGSSRPPPTLAPLNINRATVKELEALPALGPKRARSIVASRNARGGHFTTLEDLADIDGIGEHTVNAIRPYVVLGPPN
ncbi:MAG: helix-hairpin-helix domain-containing protein [Deltaproteobacteria bacterium]|nr:helix-hairpin-helix domain-containing protein [Deltaproteobacteria bacterium]MDQ3297334.1 helix-hairpin-helix domain-containing protein [Myxococcota bacterium]